MSRRKWERQDETGAERVQREKGCVRDSGGGRKGGKGRVEEAEGTRHGDGEG